MKKTLIALILASAFALTSCASLIEGVKEVLKDASEQKQEDKKSEDQDDNNGNNNNESANKKKKG